jgi:hypothetical protein
MSFKWIRDELSDIIMGNRYATKKAPYLRSKRLRGRNDDNPQLEWKYAQEPKEELGIRIDIFSLHSQETIDGKTLTSQNYDYQQAHP